MNIYKKILLPLTLNFLINSSFANSNSFNEIETLALKGDASGQINLGLMYVNGQGVAQNYAKAFEWFSKAAAQGDASGQINLGVMYERGRGVGQSDAKAVEWYSKAAAQ
ncbi:tetratricopeptide repeat protein, partial [Acinetobacter faecalis]|uniref:tetratricopeptide repeat protein n=1 Tax=Acinetobacter faecalis TaxID=2665161 RepID=UPI002A918BA3